jgi:hypothetical protein
MEKITMFPGALERYLYAKIMDFAPVAVRKVRIRRLPVCDGGCNWEVEEIDCDLSDEHMSTLAVQVIAPLRKAINLAEEQQSKNGRHLADDRVEDLHIW